MAAKKTSAATPAKADEELSRCIIKLLLKEPFFGHLLAGVVRHYGDQIPTAGVSVQGGKIRMIINPEFFLTKLTKQPERVAVVKHETLHLMFKHVLRIEKGSKKREPLLWNLAADLVVNQLIGKPWRLPDSAITLDTFPDLGLKPDMTADQYYDALHGLLQEMRKKDPTACGGGAPGAGSNARGDAQDGYGGASAEEWKDRGIKSPKSAEALSRMGGWHSDHSLWGSEADGVGTSAAKSTLDGLIARTADRVGVKNWGNLPGPLKQLIQAALDKRKPQVDWRRVVRIFSNSSRRTRIASTVRRASVRYGTFPGIKVKRLQRLAVAVDTSGSISNEELSVFFSEIHAMWRAGAEVHVFECDAAVQRIYQYRGKLPSSVGGRGGTLFDPVFKAMRDNRMEIWDGCIYLTDGHAPAPHLGPPCKLLWVVTSNGNAGPHLKFGRVVKLSHS